MTVADTYRPTGTKPVIYHELALQARGLFAGELDWLANAANLSSLLFCGLEDLNWAGFYFEKRGQLVLGPFQGRPACVRIEIGKGVCGTAAAQRETLVVPDVNEFPGHIACDVASRSEIVVPLVKGGRVVGVLDIDSPVFSRFDEEDRRGIEHLAAMWLAASDI
jgi:L-methionine (R)-S-oxide reductase